MAFRGFSYTDSVESAGPVGLGPATQHPARPNRSRHQIQLSSGWVSITRALGPRARGDRLRPVIRDTPYGLADSSRDRW